MAGPTPTVKTFWDGHTGDVQWYCAWTALLPDNLTDSVVIDVSGLAPVPSGNAVRIKSFEMTVNGDFSATLEYDNIASGIVNTTTANTRATWVSGDLFDTTWKTKNLGGITINGTVYAITSVDSTTQITLASDPGNQTAVAYSFDQTIDCFIGQSDFGNQFIRDYTDGPNLGVSPVKTSSNFVGDVILTTSGVAAGDEILLRSVFEV